MALTSHPDKILGLTSVSLVITGMTCVGLAHLVEWDEACRIGEWLIVSGIAVFLLPLMFVLLMFPMTIAWQSWISRE